MEKEFFFALLAFSISSIDLFFYWKGVIARRIIPHPFTFFIWTVVLSISTFELFENRELYWILATGILTISCLFACIVWFYQYKNIAINWIDYFFLIAGICLIVYWRLEPHYSYVLIVMIAIDASAYVSSFKKAWIQPYTERSLPYFISVWSYIATIFSISVWNFENLGMWIWTACINFIFACFILGRQYNKGK